MNIYEKLADLDAILFMVAYSIICILIFVFATKGTLSKKKDISFREKFKIIFISIYFGIFMASAPWVASINPVVATLIFLHLFLIVFISNIKKKSSLLLYVLIGDSILGMYMCICNLLGYNFSSICWYIIVIGIYIIPGLGFFESRKDIVRKIKTCTKEVDAKVVKIIKGNDEDLNMAKVYIPVLEIDYNGKKYTYMDSTGVYSYSKAAIKNIKSVFINPNSPNIDTMFGSDDVLIPGPYFRNFREQRNGIIIFYVSTFIIAILCLLLNVFF